MKINSKQGKNPSRKAPAGKEPGEEIGQGILWELHRLQPRVRARPPGCLGISKKGKAKQEGSHYNFLFTPPKEKHFPKEL